LKLKQITRYPWDGGVRLEVDPEEEAEFTLCLRIPGWARGHPVPGDLYRFGDSPCPAVTLKVNDRALDATPGEDGYVHVRRRWKAGDKVELGLPMPIRRVLAHQKIEADRGKVALMRGPVVYCLESVDHPGADVLRLVLPRDANLQAEWRGELLGGVTVLHGPALAGGRDQAELKAVPYFAWCNRGKGPMTVWIDENRPGRD